MDKILDVVVMCFDDDVRCFEDERDFVGAFMDGEEECFTGEVVTFGEIVCFEEELECFTELEVFVDESLVDDGGSETAISV